MHGAVDLMAGIRRRMLGAFLRRRVLSWLLPFACIAGLAVSGRAGAAVLLALMLVTLSWIGVDLSLWRRRIAARCVSWLDGAIPELEDSSALLLYTRATPLACLQRARLQARLDAALGEPAMRALIRSKVGFNLIPLALALTACAAAWAYGTGQAVHTAAPAVQDGLLAQTKVASIVLHALPPTYTGVAASEGKPRELVLPQHSEVRWCAHGADAIVELSDGQSLAVAARQCASWRASDSVFWRVRQQGGQRYNIRVTPDQAPVIAINAPKQSVELLKSDAVNAQISIAVSDDYAVTRATLHMTLARGSGENIRFSDREAPLPVSADARARSWSKRWQLSELGMEPGDELYFFVRASDNAPGQPHMTQSPTYTLRLAGEQAESLESTALPSMVKPENLRSQRQIIIDTEQLLADVQANPKMANALLRDRSEHIAADQAKLRLRYGQFLGEESSLFGDDEHGHDDGGKRPATGEGALAAQFGHAHDMEDNATIFDPQTKAVLRRALSAMWDAEKALRAISPKSALPPEYKALQAIKELQQAERVYLHRTAFVPPAIKEEKRLSGDFVGAQSYRRKQAAAAETVPQEVRELMQALAGEGMLPALWSRTARSALASVGDDEARLAGLRAVQDVADGCQPCRGVLRAWLRSTLDSGRVVLQATPSRATAFEQALRAKEAP